MGGRRKEGRGAGFSCWKKTRRVGRETRTYLGRWTRLWVLVTGQYGGNTQKIGCLPHCHAALLPWSLAPLGTMKVRKC